MLMEQAVGWFIGGVVLGGIAAAVAPAPTRRVVQQVEAAKLDKALLPFLMKGLPGVRRAALPKPWDSIGR